MIWYLVQSDRYVYKVTGSKVTANEPRRTTAFLNLTRLTTACNWQANVNYYMEDIAMKSLIGDEQATYGPYGLSRETVGRWPLFENCYNPKMRDAMLRASINGYFINPFPKVRAPYYRWCSNVLIPFVGFTPRRTRASVLMDLLPACSEFPEESLDELAEILRPHAGRNSFGIGIASYVDQVRVRDIEELGARLVAFVQANATYREPERTEFEKRLGVGRPTPLT